MATGMEEVTGIVPRSMARITPTVGRMAITTVTGMRMATATGMVGVRRIITTTIIQVAGVS